MGMFEKRGCKMIEDNKPERMKENELVILLMNMEWVCW